MIKLAEARSGAAAGADEVDMMINLGRLKSGDLCYVRDEIKAVVEIIAPVPLKVILEVSRLTDDEIRRGSESVVEAGAAFVKTAPAGPMSPQHSTISGLSMLLSKASVGSRPEEGSEILRPSKPYFPLE